MYYNPVNNKLYIYTTEKFKEYNLYFNLSLHLSQHDNIHKQISKYVVSNDIYCIIVMSEVCADPYFDIIEYSKQNHTITFFKNYWFQLKPWEYDLLNDTCGKLLYWKYINALLKGVLSLPQMACHSIILDYFPG